MQFCSTCGAIKNIQVNKNLTITFKTCNLTPEINFENYAMKVCDYIMSIRSIIMLGHVATRRKLLSVFVNLQFLIHFRYLKQQLKAKISQH